MSDRLPVHDDDVVFLHVPGTPAHQGIGPTAEVTSANFTLRKEADGSKEAGKSVSMSGPDVLATIVNVNERSRFATARVGDIRERGFDVVPDPTPADPQHCIIVSADRSLDKNLDRRYLKEVFRLI